ncbi:MAG: ribose 5-phosphate isomerase B [Candidatus Aenigmarchaeota archaeon]|nr:ribose 5-phosphate isomerase B [Candidatus Aenigmarchaeota archaeon]
MEKLAIGSDHAGFRLKEKLKKYLESKGFSVIDVGTDSEESVDYPDFAFKVAKLVSEGKCKRGILVCGTGLGMSIAANKVKGIRATVCWNEEVARLSRLHNDSNVLCLGGRLLTFEEAKRIVEVWLETEFEGGRHLRRIKKISEFEESRS